MTRRLYLMCVLGAIMAVGLLPLAPVQAQDVSDPTMEDPIYPLPEDEVIPPPDEPVVEGPTLAACNRRISADVVALDQVYFWNRLGAVQPHGMMYALRQDVVSSSSTSISADSLSPGNVRLREGKRPRPLVLRMNVGDCLTIRFTNLLSPNKVDEEQPATRTASAHVMGMQYVESINDGGLPVGNTGPAVLAAPGESRNYTYYAQREGTYLMYSGGAVNGGEGNNGSIAAGLFGAVNVEPMRSEWYRSQVTAADMELATTGTTPQGHPILNYDAVYPSGHPLYGRPIFKMLQNNQIVHGDLTAIITGAARGDFRGAYQDLGVVPNRNQPFREFTIIFHDEIGAVQAFPIFEDPVFSHTTHSTRDAFAINYGTGGIGAEILANRIGVGPMWDCTECKYEEFFLSAWTVGDPAMVVDVPANAPCTYHDIRDQAELAKQGITVAQQPACTPEPGPKATKAFFPDDPSNVYHSYLNDHVKFRNLLAGTDDHHIFHLHAHQWLHTPDSDFSTYLDSQAIGQGTGFTYEITWGGSGNRNKTPGDSIFHCHFYPHFAQGMWAMWRVHDVFEIGTILDAEGRPVHLTDSAGNVTTTTRALPDAEILAGTPIPGVVPIPTIAMAPMPQANVTLTNGQVQVAGNGNPGYPFWIPGVAGHRPPHPPLDTIEDGGLQRHVIVGGEAFHVETRLDFTKIVEEAEAIALPEAGTAVEQVAMDFHAQSAHSSFKPDGSAASFATNGLPPGPGAPYAEPCPLGKPHRLYKGADIEVDAVLNKKGWHFPQQRMISLWEDVHDFKFGNKPLEPLFFRANSDDCITFWLTNLVPSFYELDDFQVRTPTDVLGQHIHLVKFDVTSSDGSANGFNYEDGSFSPEEVQERVRAIRHFNGCINPDDIVNGGDPLDGTFTCPLVVQHSFFPAGEDENEDGVPDWLGAQTTVQRWWADPVTNLVNGDDRTLRTVFTHDHFGPSTHQQGGLYAGLVVERAGTDWFHNETGAPLYTRHDGGPTSWQAIIIDDVVSESYREFLFEFADFQLAYEPNEQHPLFPYPLRARQPGEGFDDPAKAINPPGRFEVGLPALYKSPFERGRCPTTDGTGTLHVVPPCPELVSADDPGMYSINYRNEPLALRLRDPATGNQAAGQAGDPSYAYSSILRADPEMNQQPTGRAPLTGGVEGVDPFTPLLRAYEGDNVQIRILVGAHEEEHNFTVHGVKWLFEPSDPNSGYRNSQMMGISEHFEFVVPQLPKSGQGVSSDFMWKAGAAVESQWNGNWGILRAYKSQRQDVQVLPNNPIGTEPTTGSGGFSGICPKSAPVRNWEVVAVPASALPGGTLTYYPLTKTVTNPDDGSSYATPLQDPTAVVFVRASDYDFASRQVTTSSIEPLILRAAAGECIQVKLYNELRGNDSGLLADLPGYNAFPHIVRGFNANDVKPSARVGLHPQLVAYDVTRSDGVNVGLNPEQTVPPGQFITYKWYAGDVSLVNGVWQFKPIEFGATGLTSSDPLKHTNKGAVGALVIEPQGSAWAEDAGQRASAWVRDYNAGQQFREHVLIYQTDVNMRYANNSPVKPAPENEDPAERGQKAFNYSADPVWVRMGIAPETPLEITRDLDFTGILSTAVAGPPQTPIFTAPLSASTRVRVLNPGGHGQAGVFELSGHVWQELPYVNGSANIGNRPISEYKGSEHGIGATRHFDVVVQNGAGGAFGVPGDYLYRDAPTWMMYHGLWGVFRVTP